MDANVQIKISTAEMQSLLIDIIEDIVHDRISEMVLDLAFDKVRELVGIKIGQLHESGQLEEIAEKVMKLNYGIAD